MDNKRKDSDDTVSEPKRQKVDDLDARLLKTMQEKFGFDEFRTHQLEIIKALIDGKDCMVILPTGSGKSLCYQLPAVLCKGTALVVSPLLALMNDQIKSLENHGITCKMISSKQTKAENSDTYDDIIWTDKIKLLFVSPERAADEDFKIFVSGLVNSQKISFFAIDEAHCVSSWGHDFRKKYRELSFFKEMFPEIPVIALTATATPRVKDDIVTNLKLVDHAFFFSTFNRPEINYIVKKGVRLIDDIVETMQKFPPNTSAIVYCWRQKDCNDYATALVHKGLNALAYHAGMNMKQRDAIQKGWTSGRTAIVCATIAFGMGIDKPDVRVVFHAAMPRSVESFYQESGRAGRDKQKALSIVYYNAGEFSMIRNVIATNARLTPQEKEVQMAAFDMVKAYCLTEKCRREFLLNYFAENIQPGTCAKTCDNCSK